MRATYEVYSAVTDVVVEHITLDVYGDPTQRGYYDAAVDAAGCTSPAYKARFVGFEGGIATVPFEVIEQLAAIVNVNRVHALSRDFEILRVLRMMLIATGYFECEDGIVNPVSPE